MYTIREVGERGGNLCLKRCRPPLARTARAIPQRSQLPLTPVTHRATLLLRDSNRACGESQTQMATFPVMYIPKFAFLLALIPTAAGVRPLFAAHGERAGYVDMPPPVLLRPPSAGVEHLHGTPGS